MHFLAFCVSEVGTQDSESLPLTVPQALARGEGPSTHLLWVLYQCPQPIHPYTELTCSNILPFPPRFSEWSP